MCALVFVTLRYWYRLYVEALEDILRRDRKALISCSSGDVDSTKLNMVGTRSILGASVA